MVNQELAMNEVYYEGKRLIVYGYKLNSVQIQEHAYLGKIPSYVLHKTEKTKVSIIYISIANLERRQTMNKLSNIQLYHHQREAWISEMSRPPYKVFWGIKYNNKRYIVEKSESFAKLLLYNSPGILPIHVTLLKPGEFVFCLKIVLNKLQYLSMGTLLRKKREHQVKIH